MEKLKQIRAVTANYFLWQGLRTSALGPILIISGLNLLQPAWYPFDGNRGLWPLLFAVAPGWLGFAAAGRYYEKTFGAVRGLPGLHSRREAVTAHWRMLEKLKQEVDEWRESQNPA